MLTAGSNAAMRKVGSLWRLRSYLRPYRGGMILTISAAMTGTLLGLAVPLLTKRIIDGPIHDGHRSGLVWLGLLAFAFGAVEAFMYFLRRWTLLTSSLGLETDLRNDLYNHLQRLPIGFHDRWQSGQLLSRATTDLSTIRRFVGFGLVFLIVNSVTLVVVGAILIFIYPPLGLLCVVLTLPLGWISLKFERRYKVQARRVQDQQG